MLHSEVAELCISIAPSFRTGNKVAKTSKGVYALYCTDVSLGNNPEKIGVTTFVHILDPALKDGATN